MLKTVSPEGTFPQLLPKHRHQVGSGTATSLKAAFAAAGRDLFSQKGLKGRRLSEFTLTVRVRNVATNGVTSRTSDKQS
jgi:hypothetical protein